MPISSPVPPGFPHPSSRLGREHEAFTVEDLANALRGMPRDAAFFVETSDGLRPVVAIAPTFVRSGTTGPETSTAPTGGRYAIVLKLGVLQS